MLRLLALMPKAAEHPIAFGGFEDDEMVAYDHGRTVREALGLGRVDQ